MTANTFTLTVIPVKRISSSLYFITRDDLHHSKDHLEPATVAARARNMVYNNSHTAFVYENDGEFFMGDVETGKRTPHHANHRTRITALSCLQR